MEPEQNNDGGNWFARHKILTLGTAAVITVGGITVWGKCVNPWLEYRKTAKETGLSIDGVREYCSLLGSQFYIKFIAKKIDLQTLEVLLKDHEIIQRAEESGFSEGLKSNINWTLLELVTGHFIYDNATGRIVDRKDVNNVDNAIYRGFYSRIEDLRIEDYLDLCNKQKDREEKIGFFTMITANKYGGISVDDLLKIPYKPTEELFGLLKKFSIDAKYALPLLQQGMRADEIVQKCAAEAGVSVDTLLEYKSIEINGGERLSNSEINVLATAGMKPSYFEEIMHWAPSYKPKVFSLIEEGKLNGQIYAQRREGGTHPIDTILGLCLGFSLDQVKRAKALGNNVSELHNDLNLQYMELLSEIIQQKKAPNQ